MAATLRPVKRLHRPSYKAGYARHASDSSSPRLCTDLLGLWYPSLGPTGTQLRDLTGKNHGTLTNMVPADDWTVSSKGWCLDLDGSNDNILLGSNIWSDGDLSQGSAVLLVSPTNVTGEKRFFSIEGAIRFSLNEDYIGNFQSVLYDGTDRNLDSGVPAQVGVWYLLVSTWTGSTQSFYVNGVFRSSGVTSSGPLVTSLNRAIRIGSKHDGTVNAACKVAMCAVYGRALSPPEIQHLHRDPLAPLRLRDLHVPIPAAAAPAGLGAAHQIASVT